MLDIVDYMFCDDSDLTLFRPCLFNSGAIFDVFQILLIIIALILFLTYNSVKEPTLFERLWAPLVSIFVYPVLKLILNSN